MRPTAATEEHFRPELRLRICAKCPLRPGRRVRANPDVPQRCEATCPLFKKLGELVRRTVLLDSMPRSRVLKHLVEEPPAKKPGSRELPFKRYRREVAHLAAQKVSI